MRKIIDRVYLSTSILGALLVASNIGAQLLGYCLFLSSSVAGIFLLLTSNMTKEERKSFLTVNVIFAIINLVGIVRA